MKVSMRLRRRGGRKARLYMKAVAMPQGTLVFDPALKIKGMAGGGLVFVEATSPVPLLGMGRTVRGALRELGGNLVWLWREYAEAKEQELTGDARELARCFRAIARRENRGWAASAAG